MSGTGGPINCNPFGRAASQGKRAEGPRRPRVARADQTARSAQPGHALSLGPCHTRSAAAHHAGGGAFLSDPPVIAEGGFDPNVND